MKERSFSKQKRQEFLRMVVLYFSKQPLGKQIFNEVYKFVLKLSSRFFLQNSHVQEIYRRKKRGLHSLNLGMSDIDLTVVLGDNPIESAKNLPKLWRLYAFLKRLFPLLGEIEFVEKRAFRDLRAFGPAVGFYMKEFQLVYSKEMKSEALPRLIPKSIEKTYTSRVLYREIVLRYLRYVFPGAIQFLSSPSYSRSLWFLHNQEQLSLRLKKNGSFFS